MRKTERVRRGLVWVHASASALLYANDVPMSAVGRLEATRALQWIEEQMRVVDDGKTADVRGDGRASRRRRRRRREPDQR